MHENLRPAAPARAEQAANEATTGCADRKAKLVPLQRDNDGSEDDLEVEGFKPLLPDGWYEARYLGHATALVFNNTPKVFLHFEITQHGEFQGTKVFRAFRVRRLKGRPASNGQFVLHAGGDLYKTAVQLLDVKSRTDRVSLRALRHMLFRVELRTVEKDQRQKLLPQQNRYSVVQGIERGE
jgi:hypothetical protein